MPPYLGFGSCSFQGYSFTGCNILDLPRSIFVQVSVKSIVLETKDYLRMPPYLGFGSCSFQGYSFTGCNILDLPRSIFVQGVCIRSKRTKNVLAAVHSKVILLLAVISWIYREAFSFRVSAFAVSEQKTGCRQNRESAGSLVFVRVLRMQTP